MATDSAPDTWYLHDGAAGHRRQAAALAVALAPAAREWRLDTAPPWAWFAPRRLPGADRAFGADFLRGLAAPPALAIGCGRRAALATRLLRQRGAKSVQVLHPRLDTAAWDLVITPDHDRRPGGNVITLCGSLNPVDEAWLAAARARYAVLAQLPSPRTVVLLGGRTSAVRFDRAAFEVMAGRLERLLERDGGSLLVLGSRRTPEPVAGLARAYWAQTPGLRWFGDADGDNPYPGALAWADRIVCSPDSVNMVSEACATTVPVFVAEPGRATGRVGAFLQELLRRGRIRPLGSEAPVCDVEALRETPRVAALVRERLGLA